MHPCSTVERLSVRDPGRQLTQVDAELAAADVAAARCPSSPRRALTST